VTGTVLTVVPRPGDSPQGGFRLTRVELFNWGTFDQHVWSFQLGGHDGLLTGDAGSGKSTLVDAVTTLLLPANRITYNKAAGAGTRERDLRSYVLGYYKGERNDTSTGSRPVALRDTGSFSVIVGVFANPGYGSVVTLAQAFWPKDQGQPGRFFVVADRDLSIAADFTGFGTDMTVLKKRLKSPGTGVYDDFPPYGRDFRRRLGIESEQAMELFHQAVSMKSVGNLTTFVREHMLEPFDAASWTKKITGHFEDLTTAHESVLSAQRQITALEPLLTDCAAYDEVTQAVQAAGEQRAALPFFFAERKTALLEEELGKLGTERDVLRASLSQLEEQLRRLRSREKTLEKQRDGHGGRQIADIEARISELEPDRDRRMTKARDFGRLLAQAGLGQAETAAQFAASRARIEAMSRETGKEQDRHGETMVELGGQKQQLTAQAGEVNSEIVSLRARKTNIPHSALALRQTLCRELELPEQSLPFAGELIEVRAAEAEWEGAAERLLHGFALSILVPGEHYTAVSGWVNERHLGTRVVYYRAVTNAAPPDARPAGRLLYGKLNFKDTEFAGWLEHEVRKRAALECVEDMADFRRLPRAITKNGQIKGSDGRHEKDDRRPIGDRSNYVLGWSNQRKTDALVKRAAALQRKLSALDDTLANLKREVKAASDRGQVLARLSATSDFSEIDWQSVVNQIEDLKREKRDLEGASDELKRLTRELGEVQGQITSADEEKVELAGKIGGLDSKIGTAQGTLSTANQVLAQPGCEAARPRFADIAALLARPPLAGLPVSRPEDCDTAGQAAHARLTDIIDGLGRRQRAAENRIVRQMGDFRRDFRAVQPETGELDDSLAAIPGYRRLHARLADDDLPRFRERFRKYLRENTIRDIATFQFELGKQAELIRERIDTINGSLADVEYNPGRFIHLVPEPAQDTDIRDFRTELRACTEDAVSPDASDQYSEQKFLQVKKLIERFRGREGQTDADRTWTRRVTDVRNWFTFSASERWRETGEEHEHYSDSSGKSGGQKEKLAYTVLAASLAYQFKLDPGAARSRTFRLAVIDEAFGRGPDKSAEFGLQLFSKLGLQLLVVTPLQKIHVIEPYVSVVGFVDNPTERCSRLHTLTVEEYRARRDAHAAVTAVTVPAGTLT
jgi:uncharacterized protein YPO0396